MRMPVRRSGVGEVLLPGHHIDHRPRRRDGMVLPSNAFRVRAMISALGTPVTAQRARSKVIGKTDRAAAALTHSGARIFGFQNSGSSNGLLQARSTRQTKPLPPFTAAQRPHPIDRRSGTPRRKLASDTARYLAEPEHRRLCQARERGSRWRFAPPSACRVPREYTPAKTERRIIGRSRCKQKQVRMGRRHDSTPLDI